jgi:TfoX/Sxy family transcriptional regulator of competence genes
MAYDSTMAYDEFLAERIRLYLTDQAGTSEKKMFGAVAFMVNGNMAVGVSNTDLMVRAGDESEAFLEESDVRPFDLSGKRMRGWLLVASPAIAEDGDLSRWIDVGVAVAVSLPPK